MKLNIKEISKILKCSNGVIRTYLCNYRFQRFRVEGTRPPVYEVNIEFFNELKDMVECRRHAKPKAWHYNIDNLRTVVTP